MKFPYYETVPKGFVANLRWRRDVLELARCDAGYASSLREMCSRDLLFYVNGFCWTSDPRNARKRLPSKVPFITYRFQDEAITQIMGCIDSGSDFVIPKSRDMGASWMCLLVFEWYWHFRENLSFLVISRNEDYVDKAGNPKSLFWKIDFLHQNQPRWLLPGGRWLGWKDPERRLLHLGNSDNGSVIDGESTTGDAGRGDRRTAMLIDEHAAFDVNDGFRVLSASRDTTDCRGFNSTHKGVNTAFNKVVEETNAVLIRLHWSVHPEKNRGLYSSDPKTGKVTLHDDYRSKVRVGEKGSRKFKIVQFPDEYPFIKDGKLRSPWYDSQRLRCANDAEIAQELDIDAGAAEHQFFDPDFIKGLKEQYVRAPLSVGDIEYCPETFLPRRYTEEGKGRLSLWLSVDGDNGISSDRKFAVGVDIAAGTGASNSVASIVDLSTGEKVGVWASPHIEPSVFAVQVVALCKWFNDAYLIWDGSGPTGTVFGKKVVNAGYGRIYYRRNERKFSRRISDEPGYFLNPGCKTHLLEEYREALSQHRFINRSARGLDECLQFIRLMDGTVEHSAAVNAVDPSGARAAHGDEVIADALASLAIQEVSSNPTVPDPGMPVGCLAWRRQQYERERSLAGADQLGEGW